MHGVVYAFSSKGETYLESFNKVLAANTDLLSVHLNLNASVMTSRQCIKWNPRGNLTHRDANILILAETIARTAKSVVPE